jgi:hypothetical protein
MLEEHHGGPVVAKVLRKSARCAAASVTDIPVHSRIEGISTNNLVEMS